MRSTLCQERFRELLCTHRSLGSVRLTLGMGAESCSLLREPTRACRWKWSSGTCLEGRLGCPPAVSLAWPSAPRTLEAKLFGQVGVLLRRW